MLYKVVVASAIALSAAVPATDEVKALSPEKVADVTTSLKRENEVFMSMIAQLRGKVDRYSVLAESEGMKFHPFAAANLAMTPEDMCVKKGMTTYLECLDKYCLTTECEQKKGSKTPFDGFGSWTDKMDPGACDPKTRNCFGTADPHGITGPKLACDPSIYKCDTASYYASPKKAFLPPKEAGEEATALAKQNAMLTALADELIDKVSGFEMTLMGSGQCSIKLTPAREFGQDCDEEAIWDPEYGQKGSYKTCTTTHTGTKESGNWKESTSCAACPAMTAARWRELKDCGLSADDKKEKKKYWMHQGMLDRMCLDTANDFISSCEA